MFEHIERLRQKSDREKKRFAFFVAFSFTLVILTLWYFAVLPSFKEQTEIDKKIEKYESSPSTSLSSIFGGKISEIKSQFGVLKEYAGALTQKNAYYSSTNTPPVASTTTEIEE